MFQEVIIAFLNAVAFSSLVFYPVFLSGSYVPFFMANFITTCIGIVLGYLVAAVSPTMEIANSVSHSCGSISKHHLTCCLSIYML